MSNSKKFRPGPTHKPTPQVDEPDVKLEMINFYKSQRDNLELQLLNLKTELQKSALRIQQLEAQLAQDPVVEDLGGPDTDPAARVVQ